MTPTNSSGPGDGTRNPTGNPARTTALGISTAEYNAMQAKNMREDTLQSAVIHLAQQLGWLVYHTHDSRRSQAGFPDLVLVHERQARLLFRELKVDGSRGVISPDQKRWLKQLEVAGADVAVWRPTDWFNRKIETELYGGADPWR